LTPKIPIQSVPGVTANTPNLGGGKEVVDMNQEETEEGIFLCFFASHYLHSPFWRSLARISWKALNCLN